MNPVNLGPDRLLAGERAASMAQGNAGRHPLALNAAISRVQFAFPADRSGHLVSFSCGRSLRIVGGLRPTQCLLGEFRAVRCVHGNAQLVFAQGDDSGLGHHSHLRRSVVGPLPYRWVANARGRMGGRNSSHDIRDHNGGGFGIESSFRLFRVFGRWRSVPSC